MEFNNKVMKRFYILIYNSTPHRMFLEGKSILQLIHDMRVGDWFLYTEYAVIRIYGFEEEPYKLLVFLTPRILAMEYVRHRFISDDMHFGISGSKGHSCYLKM